MEQENFQIKNKEKNSLMEVTLLSKYLAMVLFIILPFIGGWIGYKYAPVKNLETKTIIYKDAQCPIFDTNEEKIIEDELSPYQARIKHIEEYKSNPNLTIDDIYVLHGVLTFDERMKIYAAARKYVIENSFEGIEFSLIFDWKKGDWIKFEVIPENIETDNAQLFMRYEAGQWILEGFGTAFFDLYEKYPELFSEYNI